MFEFTEEDLKSNKRGFMSSTQKETLKNYAAGIRHTQWGGLKVVVFFLLLGLSLILGMFLSVEGYRKALFTDPLILISLAVTVAIVLGIFALSIYAAYRRADRLSNAKLKMVVGAAQLDETHSSGMGSAYYVVVAKVKFIYPQELIGTFKEGNRYRIFYCDTSMFNFMLSYERLD